MAVRVGTRQQGSTARNKLSVSPQSALSHPCHPSTTFSLPHFFPSPSSVCMVLCFWLWICHYGHDMYVEEKEKANQQRYPPLLSTLQKQWVGKSTLNLYKYLIANSILNSWMEGATVCSLTIQSALFSCQLSCSLLSPHLCLSFPFLVSLNASIFFFFTKLTPSDLCRCDLVTCLCVEVDIECIYFIYFPTTSALTLQ